MRTIYYPVIDGSRVRHICARPGPQPLPTELRKANVTLRLCGVDVQRVAQAAAAAGMTRQAWLEQCVLDGLRMAESA